MKTAKRGPAPVAKQPPINPYQQAIGIIAAGYDATKIAVALAQKHPQIFIELFRETNTPPPDKWMQDLIGMLYRKEVVTAIKYLRDKTGIGLKEAKDVCDNLREAMEKNGYMITAGGRANQLPETLLPLYKNLENAVVHCK